MATAVARTPLASPSKARSIARRLLKALTESRAAAAERAIARHRARMPQARSK